MIFLLFFGGHLLALLPGIGGEAEIDNPLATAGLAAVVAAWAIGLLGPSRLWRAGQRRAALVGVGLVAVVAIAYLVVGVTAPAQPAVLDVAAELIEPPAAPGDSWWAAVAMVVTSLCVVSLVGVLLAGAGQGSDSMGIRRNGLAREAALGVPLLLPLVVWHLIASMMLAIPFLLTGGIEAETATRTSAFEGLLAEIPVPGFVLVIIFAALAEEVAFRGFFLPRLRVITGRWWVAVLVSSVLFGLGHGYEGTLAMAQATALGVGFSVIFLWRGRLAAAVIAHALFNGLALVGFALLV